MADRRVPTGVLALVAVALCCAVPAIAVVAGGLIVSSWGLALRFWPIAVVGAGLLILGVIGLAHRVKPGSAEFCRVGRGSS